MPLAKWFVSSGEIICLMKKYLRQLSNVFCLEEPQWLYTYVYQIFTRWRNVSSLRIWRLFSVQLLSEPMLNCCPLGYGPFFSGFIVLTHWSRVTHICVSKLTIIGSDNGLSPGRHQTIIWTNTGNSLTGPLGTNFSEIFIEICTFSLRKSHLKNCGHFVSASMC